MKGRLPARKRVWSKRQAARAFLDGLLLTLVDLQKRGRLLADFEVAVLGHAAEPGQPPRLLSLLPGTPPGRLFRPLTELVPVLSGELPRRRWLGRFPAEGRAALAESLAQAHRLVQQWLQSHPGVHPPLIIHCHDGRELDELHGRTSRALQVLGLPGGQVLLLQCVFTREPAGRISPLGNDGNSASRWHELWERSSPLPAHPNNRANLPQRGLYVNVCKPVRQTLRHLFHNIAILAEPVVANNSCTCEVRPLWFVKQGNADKEWEDAYAVDSSRGVAVVCDGAGEGIFSRTWARLLGERFVEQMPDLMDSAVLAVWLQEGYKAWRDIINFPTLRWSQQNKVLETGAATTFLSLRLRAPWPGTAAEDGAAGWEAVAVGDSCLFWVRDNQLLTTFPLSHSSQFALGPALFRTRPGCATPVPLLARGNCRPGDIFVLATDAVAQNFFLRCEAGDSPDWQGFSTVSETSWREGITSLRQQGKIVNDDCTLLLLRVGTTPESAPLAEATSPPP
jgi:hypothetical protein